MEASEAFRRKKTDVCVHNTGERVHFSSQFTPNIYVLQFRFYTCMTHNMHVEQPQFEVCFLKRVGFITKYVLHVWFIELMFSTHAATSTPLTGAGSPALRPASGRDPTLAVSQ